MPYFHANRVAIAERNQFAMWIELRCVGDDPDHAAVMPGFELLKIDVGSYGGCAPSLCELIKGPSR